MVDQARKQYATRVLEGVGKIPALDKHVSKPRQNNRRIERRLAAKTTKKPYRLNEKQKSFLVYKFNIGQYTGREIDPEMVAREMRGERDAHVECLFSKSEFITPGQVSSFFSRLIAKTRKQPAEEPLEEDDLPAVTEEENFVTAAVQLVHPIICDQQNVCEMVNGAESGEALVLLH